MQFMKINLKKASARLTWLGAGIIGVLLITYGIYHVYWSSSYYVSSGSSDAERVTNIAIGKKDPHLCNKIKVISPPFMAPSEEDIIRECYFRIAHTLKDSTICEFIEGDEMYKNICVRDIARGQNR